MFNNSNWFLRDCLSQGGPPLRTSHSAVFDPSEIDRTWIKLGAKCTIFTRLVIKNAQVKPVAVKTRPLSVTLSRTICHNSLSQIEHYQGAT